jgi:DNA-binding response OmpR family regulator
MPDILLLLVEDDAILRLDLEEGLTDAGFACLPVSDGSQAIEELTADPQRFRALLTDIRLGDGPTGWDIAQRGRELVPDMPVLYMSGDSSQEWTSKGVPGSVMVAKPYVMAQIFTAVSQLLTARDMLQGQTGPSIG